MDSKPAGKRAVWIVLGLIVLALIVMMFRPNMGRDHSPAVGAAATQAEIEQSTVPGAADRQPGTIAQNGGPTAQPGASQQP